MTRDQSPTPTVAAIGELHFEGNIVPHTFYSRPEFKSEKGVTQHLAILIYADDLYWYRPTQHRNELTGVVERVTRKFSGDKLQRTYDYYAQLFGVSKESATAAVKFLVDRGLSTREFRTIKLPDGRKASNVMFVEPVVEAVKVLLQLDTPESQCWYWVAEPPKPNVKKEKGKGGGIPNKPDTYPVHSGYLSQVDRRRIRSIPETNTESSTGTSSETSSKNSSSSTPAPPVDPDPRPDDDDQAAVAGKQEGLPDQVTPEGGEDLPLSGNDEAQVEGAKLNQATSIENVPPAAAGLAALQPVPRKVLEGRPARDPERNTTLRALLSASHKSRIEYLHSELAGATHSGIPMILAVRLTDEELERARDAAKADTTPALSFATAARRAVERLIGETHAPTSAPRGVETQVLNAAQAPRKEPEPDRPAETIEVGTRWEHKKIEDKIVTIVEITGGKVELHTGESLLSYMLTRDYKRVN